MNKFITLLVFLVVSNSIALAEIIGNEKKVDYIAFCYHDVHSEVFGKLYNDSGAVNTKYLISHFQWLKLNGYTVITTKMVNQAKKGLITLPEKSVLLSFDDGYQSFYKTIYPLLQQFKYPATFAIVTNWIGDPSEKIYYGDELKSKAEFMSWEQVKELSNSPLIEIASHSHNLHKGVIANPQGNTQPAATTRIYQNNRYETDQEYKDRIYSDMKTSRDLLLKHTGVAPKTFVWPYGSYSQEAWEVAESLGYETSLVLEEGENRLHDDIYGKSSIGRHLISSNPTVNEFKSNFLPKDYQFAKRVMHIDLDYVYDENAVQMNKNLDLLLERVKNMSINTVYLQAFSDEDGDGNANALYFPNDHLPVKADLFNRVSWQLKTRALVDVYAWMPISSFELADNMMQDLGVKSWQNGNVAISKNNYKRLSIFKQKSKDIIFSIYRSLAKGSKFAGILYHDDGLLTDKEDLNQEALDYYRNHGIEFNSIQDLLKNADIQSSWAQLKTDALIEFTNELTEQIKYYLPLVKTSRNIYSRPIIQPESERWFAQNFDKFVDNYDFTAVMAMPYMEKQSRPLVWLGQLVESIKESKQPLNKVIFELQTKDWNSNNEISTQNLIEQIKLLGQLGVANLGYYPDDFIRNHPDFDLIRPHFSLASYPYIKR